MNLADKLQSVAQTDSTFRRVGANWVGKCLICNGPLAFDAKTGEGATLEHIRARGRGGTSDLDNLAIVHGRCNWEKGDAGIPRNAARKTITNRSSLAFSNGGWHACGQFSQHRMIPRPLLSRDHRPGHRKIPPLAGGW